MTFDITVGRLSLFTLGIIFILYIISHLIILLAKKNIEEELMEKPGNKDNEQKLKYLTILANWFPAIAVVGIIIILYLI